jgi:hypothetical protein
MTSATNGTNVTTPIPTIADIERAMIKAEGLLNPTAWVLVSPSGEVFAGQPEVLLQVLMPHHPLLKSMQFSENSAASTATDAAARRSQVGGA